MRHAVLALLSSTLLLALFWACGGEEGACKFTSDCESGQQCSLGRCVTPPSSIYISDGGVSNRRPIAVIDGPGGAGPGDVVRLDGSESKGVDGETPTYAWSFVSRPLGAISTLSSATGDSTSFVPDLVGEYKVQLVARSGGFDSNPNTHTVNVIRDPSEFDVNQMYVMGTLSPGSGEVDMVCDVLAGDSPSPGFDSGSDTAPASELRNPHIRPTDGRLLYVHPDTYDLRLFTSEPLIWDEEDERWNYPEDPAANDTSIATPPCDGTDGNGLRAFLIHPGTGDVIHKCRSGDTWYDKNGTVFPICQKTGSRPLRLDRNGALLCSGSVISAQGVEFDLPSSTDFFEYHSKPGSGWWVVDRNDSDRFERYSITSSGAVSLDGTYAAVPTGYGTINADVPGWAGLDGRGRFYRWVSPPSTSDDAIVRFSEDFQDAVEVYTEATDPICKLHAFNFIVGP